MLPRPTTAATAGAVRRASCRESVAPPVLRALRALPRERLDHVDGLPRLTTAHGAHDLDVKSHANEFYPDGARGKVASGAVNENVLTLKLKEPSAARKTTYLKEMSWSQERLLIGRNGIAALAFCDVPILAEDRRSVPPAVSALPGRGSGSTRRPAARRPVISFSPPAGGYSCRGCLGEEGERSLPRAVVERG